MKTIKTDYASEHQGLILCGPLEPDSQYILYLNPGALVEEQNLVGVLNEAQIDYASSKHCMKHMNDLIKVYKKMIENMGVSGIHANDPFLYTGTYILACARSCVSCV